MLNDVQHGQDPRLPLELERRPAIVADRRDTTAAQPALTEAAIADAVGYILDDCFFAVGQAVGMHKTVDQSAVIWWRDRYRVKFGRTIATFGNRWLQDRSRVVRTIRMLGERAVHYAGDNPSIDLASAIKASADMEKYCSIHALRASRAGGDQTGRARYAGYWCTF